MITVEWKFNFVWLSLLSRDRVCWLFFTKLVSKQAGFQKELKSPCHQNHVFSNPPRQLFYWLTEKTPEETSLAYYVISDCWRTHCLFLSRANIVSNLAVACSGAIPVVKEKRFWPIFCCLSYRMAEANPSSTNADILTISYPIVSS